MRYDMGVFLLRFKNKQTNKQKQNKQKTKQNKKKHVLQHNFALN